MTCARLVQHYQGLTWTDVRTMPLRDFNTLVEQMTEDLEEQARAEGRSRRGPGGERRTPVMT